MRAGSWNTLVLLCICSGCYGSSAESPNSCSFFYNRAPSPQPGLTDCTWYNESSCCTQEDVDAAFRVMKPLPGSSPECQRYTEYMMCYICAPNQDTFYHQGKLTVCEEFCNVWYDACSSDIDIYKNGREMCEKNTFHFEPNGNNNCFTYGISKTRVNRGHLTLVAVLSHILIICFNL